MSDNSLVLWRDASLVAKSSSQAPITVSVETKRNVMMLLDCFSSGGTKSPDERKNRMLGYYQVVQGFSQGVIQHAVKHLMFHNPEGAFWPAPPTLYEACKAARKYRKNSEVKDPEQDALDAAEAAWDEEQKRARAARESAHHERLTQNLNDQAEQKWKDDQERAAEWEAKAPEREALRQQKLRDAFYFWRKSGVWNRHNGLAPDEFGSDVPVELFVEAGMPIPHVRTLAEEQHALFTRQNQSMMNWRLKMDVPNPAPNPWTDWPENLGPAPDHPDCTVPAMLFERWRIPLPTATKH